MANFQTDELFSIITGKRVFVIPGVDDIKLTLQSFKWPDFVICGVFLLLCLLVGIYFGFFYDSTLMEEYLTGDRKLKVIPVTMSLVASSIGGIILFKIPNETYLYGMQHLYLILGHLLMTVVMTSVFLPVLYRAKSISIYEYLEKRFNRKVRIFGASLFIISMVAWLPVTLNFPILMFGQVTNFNVQYTATILCIICTFNISLGGIKAIVWTDTFYTIFITLALLLITIKGTLDIKDFNVIIERNLQSTRIEGPNLNFFSSKYTFWSTTIGGCIYFLHMLGMNQNILQKYMSLPSLRSAKMAAWLFFLIISFIFILLTFCGFLIFAFFYDCDPITTKLSSDKDQLLPLLVMKVLGEYPSLSGVFVVGIWSASLSSWSTTLNAITAVVIQDFYPFFSPTQMIKKQLLLMKLIPTIFSVIYLCLIFTLNNVSLLQISEDIILVTSGPLLGLFTAGILLPWINAKGALLGTMSSLIFMIWFSTTKSVDGLIFTEKPVTTEGCRYHFTPPEITSFNESFSYYHISYLWYTLIGSVILIFVALFTSFIGESSDPRDVDPLLLAPFMKKIIKPREFPNEPGDGIIYAFYITERKDSNVIPNAENGT